MDQPELDMYYGATNETFHFAAELRKSMTDAEKILWSILRKNQMGFKFRRQHPIHRFIADFYCHALMLVIEIDGSFHDISNQKVYDIGRSDELQEFGIQVIRFRNEDILENPLSVIYDIEAVIERLKSQ